MLISLKNVRIRGWFESDFAIFKNYHPWKTLQYNLTLLFIQYISHILLSTVILSHKVSFVLFYCFHSLIPHIMHIYLCGILFMHQGSNNHSKIQYLKLCALPMHIYTSKCDTCQITIFVEYNTYVTRSLMHVRDSLLKLECVSLF